jgi:PAS domain S-box-containing protein
MLSLENLRTVFGCCPEARLVLYPDAPRFTIAYANPSYLQATRRNAQDLVGKGIFEAFPDTQTDISRASDINKSLNHVLEHKSAYKSGLFRFNLPNPQLSEDQAHFWVCDTYPLLNECGSIEYIVRSPLNVTQFISEGASNPRAGKLLMKDIDNPLFQDHPDAVFTLDLQGNFINVNKQLIEITECPEDELLKMSFHRFIDQEDFQLVASHFEKAVKGEIQHFNAHVIGAQGTRVILDVTHLPVFVNGEVVGIYIIAKDVTAIKKGEQQLEAYHNRISNILESVTDGFLALDRNYTVTYWNKEAERILCKAREETMGKNLWDLYPEAVQQKFYSEYHRAMAENISIQFLEYLEVVNCWLEVTAYPLEDGLSIFFKDVTNRIKSEEELEEAKRQYQELFDFNPLPNWVFDVETLAILDVNKAAVEHYGYSREEFLSLNLKDVRPPEDVPGLMQIMTEKVIPGMACDTQGDNVNFGRHCKKSGEIINVEVKGSVILFHGRKARLAVIIDTTERLKAAHELIISEQRFKALVQEGSDLIHIIDEQGFYKYVSPNTNRVLERDFKIGDKAFKSVLEPDKQALFDTMARLEKGESAKVPSVRCRDDNDQIQWMEVTLTNLMDDQAVKGIVANSRNVTEQIKSALKIKESVEQYDIVSEATSDAIYECNISTNYLKWNKGFQVLFGHDPSASHDPNRWFQMLHPEDKDGVLAQMGALFHIKEEKATLEYRFKCSDGTFKHVLDRCYFIYDEHGAPMRIIGAMQDVTDRINYIHRLEQKNKKLSEISWMQSHVVRAPLAQIMGLAELLAVDERDEEKKALLSRLRDSANDLDHVVRDIIRKTKDV